MIKSRLLAVLLITVSFAACGGNKPKEVDCEKGLEFQNRVEGRRVESPEGLDQLDEFAEMQIPRADPEAAAISPGTCADSPPLIGTQ